MKKLNALIAMIAVGFIAGCGGGSSDVTTPPPIDADPMIERDLITIFYHTPNGMCEDVEFQSYLKGTLAAEGYVVDYFLFREETNDVTCATYGKTNDITETGGCITTDLVLQDPSFSVNDTSCVIGVDIDVNAQPVTKHTDSTLKVETQNADIVFTINSAIQGW